MQEAFSLIKSVILRVQSAILDNKLLDTYTQRQKANGCQAAHDLSLHVRAVFVIYKMPLC